MMTGRGKGRPRVTGKPCVDCNWQGAVHGSMTNVHLPVQAQPGQSAGDGDVRQGQRGAQG